MRLEVTDIRTLTDECPSVRELEFRKPPVSLGSHSENMVQLPDIAIAAHYATLDIINDQWVFRPTLRDNLAKHNGEPITGPVSLGDGDVVEITHFSMRILLDTEQLVELPEKSATDDLARIRQFPVPPRTEIRKPEADVSLNAARQRSLSDFTMRIRECNDVPRLLEAAVHMMVSEFDARAAWMGVRRDANGPLEFMDGLTAEGKYLGQPPHFESFEYRCLARHQFLLIPRTGDEDTQSVLALPILTSRGALGLLYVDSRKHTRVYDGGDLDFLTLAARLIAPILESVIDRRVETTREQAVGALGVIQEMQARLDPRSVPEWPGLQFAAFTRSGTTSAGDLYDIMRLPNGLAALLVVHVSAEPARTAVALAQIRGAFRLAGLHADPPRTQLKAINWLLFDNKDPCRVDAAILVANPRTGVAELSTAGAIGVVQVRADGKHTALADSKALPVAATRSFDYGGSTIRLKNGETLAFFTPGLTAARNHTEESLGRNRLVEALCDGFKRPALAAMDELLQDLSPFLKTGNTPDDITLLLLHRPE